MVRHARNVSSALELNDSKVCVQAGTTTELNLQDYFRVNGMKFEAVPTGTAEDALKAYESGRCDVLTADASQLHGELSRLRRPTITISCPRSFPRSRWAPWRARTISNGSTS